MEQYEKCPHVRSSICVVCECASCAPVDECSLRQVHYRLLFSLSLSGVIAARNPIHMHRTPRCVRVEACVAEMRRSTHIKLTFQLLSCEQMEPSGGEGKLRLFWRKRDHWEIIEKEKKDGKRGEKVYRIFSPLAPAISSIGRAGPLAPSRSFAGGSGLRAGRNHAGGDRRHPRAGRRGLLLIGVSGRGRRLAGRIGRGHRAGTISKLAFASPKSWLIWPLFSPPESRSLGALRSPLLALRQHASEIQARSRSINQSILLKLDFAALAEPIRGGAHALRLHSGSATGRGGIRSIHNFQAKVAFQGRGGGGWRGRERRGSRQKTGKIQRGR